MGLTIGAVEEAARNGKWPLVLWVDTRDAAFQARVIAACRSAINGSSAAVDEHVFNCSKISNGAEIVMTARTLPMLAPARLVVVRMPSRMRPVGADAFAHAVLLPKTTTSIVIFDHELDAACTLGMALAKHRMSHQAKG